MFGDEKAQTMSEEMNGEVVYSSQLNLECTCVWMRQSERKRQKDSSPRTSR
jgi:hypothetical protein